MRAVVKIKVESVVSGRRLPVNPKALLFAIKLLQKELFPPISVERLPGGMYKLHNGRHRLSAHRLVGRDSILACVAIPEDPNPFTRLVYNGSPGSTPVPQADGYSLNERATSHE